MPQNNHFSFLSLLLLLSRSIDCFQWSQIQQSSHVISSYLGSDATLPCEFLLSAPESQQMQQFYVVLWSRQSNSLTPLSWQALASITNINNAVDSSTKIIFPDQNKFRMTNNTLTVFSVGIDDDNHYQCEVKSSFYTTPSMVKLNVLYKPFDTQLLASKTSMATGKEGFELNCTARANPKAGYAFFLDGNLIQNTTSYQYIISKATTQHSGEYSCIPWNYVGEGPNDTVHIKVEDSTKTTTESSISDEVLAGITGAVALTVVIIVVMAIVCKRFRDDKKQEPSKPTSTPSNPSDETEAHIGPGIYGSEASIGKESLHNYTPPLPKLYKLNAGSSSVSS